MPDIHCHILPGVDDGAATLNESVEMARTAARSGVTEIIATPHCNVPGEQGNFASRELAQRFYELRGAIDAAGIPLRIYAGAEIFCTPETPSLFEQHRLLTLASTDYLLTEFYFDESRVYMDNMLRVLAEKGAKPVVAHPERYDCVRRDISVVADWFRAGYVIQVNKGSILGRFGYEVFETADRILRRGLAHIVASDAHGADTRTTDMRSVRETLEKDYAPGYAKILLETNPANIIGNRAMAPVK